MVLHLLRVTFIFLAASVTLLYLVQNQWGAGVNFGTFLLILGITIATALAIIALDASQKRKKLSALSGVFLGLIAGLVAAFALSFVVDLVAVLTIPEFTVQPVELTPLEYDQLSIEVKASADRDQALYEEQLAQREAYMNLFQGVKVLIGLVTCYLGISLVLQTKDDFRFVIPYVEFAKQIRGNRPTILDTSVIVDGRVLDIIETKLMQGVVIAPKFVLNELQTIADSADKMRRARGRRGLDILQKLQTTALVDVVIDEAEVEGVNVDQKLISLAQQLQARVMTNDFNLNKIATLRGVDVINLNDLAKALRPVVLPGEAMIVKLVKPGEAPTQGVGYLEDGTMVVVEDGRDHLGQPVELSVTSTLQTSAGRMIFGKFERPAADEPPRAASERGRPDSDDSAAGIPHEHVAAGTHASQRHTPGRNPRRPH